MSTAVQAIIISKEHYSLKSANNWIKLHNLKPIKKVHTTINVYRYRLKEPNENLYNYRMKHITTGIMAVIEYPK